MIMISNFLFNFINFLGIVSFFWLITNIIYFIFNSSKNCSSSYVISPLTSFLLALRVVLVAKLVILSILSLKRFILAPYTSFLTTSFFATSLSLLQSTGTGTNLSASNLSTLYSKLAKLTFLANFNASTHLAFYNILLMHDNYINLIQLSLFLLKILVLENIHSLILCLFYQSNC